MAVTYGFFDSINGDRKYNADQMSEFYTGIANDGVFQHIDNGLAVSAGTGLTVNVATGRALIQKKWVKNDAVLTKTISAASATYARIDAVVIRFSKSNRNVSIVVKDGTPAASPSAPSMTRNSDVYEMALAYVNVAANATSVTVTDKRSDTTVCGWVSVAQQTSGEVDAMLNDMKTGFDGVVYPSPAAMVQGCDELVVDMAMDQETIPAPTMQGYIKPGGTYGQTSAFRCTDFIAIPEDTTSISIIGDIVTNASISLLAFYTTNVNDVSSVISTFVPNGSPIITDIPTNAKYIRMTDNQDPVGNAHTFTATFNSAYGTNKVINLKNKIDDIQMKIASFYLSDITTDFVNTDKYITNVGNLGSIPGYSFAVTDPIAVPDDAISISVRGAVTNTGGLQIAFYTDSVALASSFISGVSGAGHEYDVNIPIGTKYIRIGSNTNSGGTTFGTLDYKYSRNTYLADKFASVASADVKLKAAGTYDMIVGDTLELFYKGIIDSVKDENYYVMASCPIGGNFRKKFMVTPTTAGTSTLALSLYNGNGALMDTKSISLIARATPTSPGTAKNILCVGDSLTVGGQWPKEFSRRMIGSGGTPTGFNLSNVNFIGSCVKDGVHFEGYGGWTFQQYNTSNVSANFKLITCVGHDKTIGDQHSIYKDGANNQWKLETIESGQIKIILTSGNASTFPATGTLTWVSGGEHHTDITYTASENAPGNPFWDTSANKVDFASYCTRIGASGIDYIYVLLGWNAAGNTKAVNKQQAQTFINNVKASYENAKIILMGLQIPARDGLGFNYGATGTWANYKNLVKYVHDLDDLYAEIVADNTNVYQLNISAQFDTENNMPTGTRPVNTRNATTETFQNNGVHPAESGYLQIADAVTRHIVGIL